MRDFPKVEAKPFLVNSLWIKLVNWSHSRVSVFSFWNVSIMSLSAAIDPVCLSRLDCALIFTLPHCIFTSVPIFLGIHRVRSVVKLLIGFTAARANSVIKSERS